MQLVSLRDCFSSEQFVRPFLRFLIMSDKCLCLRVTFCISTAKSETDFFSRIVSFNSSLCSSLELPQHSDDFPWSLCSSLPVSANWLYTPWLVCSDVLFYHWNSVLAPHSSATNQVTWRMVDSVCVHCWIDCQLVLSPAQQTISTTYLPTFQAPVIYYDCLLIQKHLTCPGHCCPSKEGSWLTSGDLSRQESKPL